ncbi:NADPH-dependent 2,4-dienoyl-CoA reductase/sulfur reductase-like enzyme [Luteibacter rhizovicinus]|uniref:NADPH-dependent 2,4-dienoyl-CoA reductase/sulfur reductase-like enzyme n=1 Tax=Luteibacter rhizovicinus TaxID=242606 RepID=A0A4V2W4Y2_9GAMM|nr:FAD-dependent oxidoreductase [Luteibacter rhizovicinus]TCV97659.1 NADPH-dependent 2,4-dienoyl-CoA reductase/sulfur reductase-like enzyme [Luteibacter rhizovicinus]
MNEYYDVLVVGAGPAGLAAAQAATSHGARVGLIDAQATAGGQVWRHDVRHAAPSLARRSIGGALTHSRVDWLARTQVVAVETGSLFVEDPRRGSRLDYGALVLATGARELLLPFPGWTLPGVTGAGGLQALAKQGWPLAGRRVLIAGSGPLLLAAAATAKRHGATVLGIYEQAGADAVRRFAGSLWRWPAKAIQAALLRGQLAGVPYRCGSVVRRALGDSTLRTVELEGPHGIEQVPCDQLAIGYGLLPNVELAQLLGCELRWEGAHPQVSTDIWQQTNIDTVYAAGEVCGIGGRDSARVEGAIAGHAAAGARSAAMALQPRRRHARAFAEALRTRFALDARVYALATPDTLICRCEDVALSDMDGYTDTRSAKLATRCGMGACQGRICGAALAELGRFSGGGQRPPLFPARLSTLGDTDFFPLATIEE